MKYVMPVVAIIIVLAIAYYAYTAKWELTDLPEDHTNSATAPGIIPNFLTTYAPAVTWGHL